MKTKVICVLIALIMVLDLIPQIVFAGEVTSKIFNCSDFTVDYSVTDSWGDSQNITVTITNISSKPIENWMLAYDLCGEIQGIWNGTAENEYKSAYFV